MPKTNRNLEAFCEACPAAADVAAMLQPFGFCLTFHMDACTSPESSGVPSLPPQYHYADLYGTEVIYLAGYDTPEQGKHFPAHQSRFWLVAGGQELVVLRVRDALAAQWKLHWREERSAKAAEGAA